MHGGCLPMLYSSCLEGIFGIQGQRKPGLGDDVRRRLARPRGGRDRVRFLLNPALNSRRIDDFYEAGKQIGAGAFGTVERRLHKQTRQYRAVKQIKWTSVWQGRRKNEENERLIKCELQTLITLDHPNLVQFREWFEDPQNGIFFVMELCDGGGLDSHLEYIAGMREEDRPHHVEHLQALLRQLCYAVSYIHAQGVVHRDLKPANVLLSGKAPRRSSSASAPSAPPLHLEAKLIDFGLASLRSSCGRWGDAVDDTPVGTLEFMAPELFLARENACSCYDKGDVWALGVIFSWMVTAVRRGELLHPFLGDAGGDKARIYYHLFCAYRGDEPWKRGLFEGEPASAFAFADKALVLDPAFRASAHELLHMDWVAQPQDADGASRRRPSRQHLRHVKGWAKLGKFDRMVLTLVAAHAGSDSKIESLTRAFWVYDVDKDGKLNREELRKGFEATGQGLSDDELEDIFVALDLDGTGGIDFGEFLAATIDKSYLRDAAVMDDAFHSLDFQQRGELHSDELLDTFGAEEHELPLSPDGSHRITRQDFGHLMGLIATRRESQTRKTTEDFNDLMEFGVERRKSSFGGEALLSG